MKKFFSFIVQSVDLFPVPLQITYRRRNSYSTKVSKFLSLGTLSLILYLVITEAYYTISLVNPQINTVMVQGQQADPFLITADDFYVLTNFTFNGSSFHINQSQGQIFNLSVEECTYASTLDVAKCRERSMVRCSEANVPSQLMKEMNLNETNLQDNYCLNYSQLASDPLQIQISFISSFYINVNLYKCQNTTKNSNSKNCKQLAQGCADQSLIDYYLNSGLMNQSIIYASKTPKLDDLNQPYTFRQMNKSFPIAKINSQLIMTQFSPQYLYSKENPFFYFGQDRYFRALVQDNDAYLNVPTQKYLSQLQIKMGYNSISSMRKYDNILNVIARYKSLLDVAIIFLFPFIATYNKYCLNQSLIKNLNQDDKKSVQSLNSPSSKAIINRSADLGLNFSNKQDSQEKLKLKEKLLLILEKLMVYINSQKQNLKNFLIGETINNLHLDIIQVIQTVKENKNLKKTNNYEFITSQNNEEIQKNFDINGIGQDKQNPQYEPYEGLNQGQQQPFVSVFQHVNKYNTGRLEITSRQSQFKKLSQANGDKTI